MTDTPPTALERQAIAAEQQLELLQDMAVSLASLERLHRPEPELYARASFPKRLDRLAAGVVVPGMLEQFRVVVPDEFVEDDAVKCVCGSATPVAPARVTECLGSCGRFFLQSRGGVRCARYPVEWVAA
jgi:hypothetical protein